MISYIRGTIEDKEEGFVVVETSSGIGFEIRVNNETLTKLPPVGEEVKLLTHLQVTENDRVL